MVVFRVDSLNCSQAVKERVVVGTVESSVKKKEKRVLAITVNQDFFSHVRITNFGISSQNTSVYKYSKAQRYKFDWKMSSACINSWDQRLIEFKWLITGNKKPKEICCIFIYITDVDSGLENFTMLRFCRGLSRP